MNMKMYAIRRSIVRERDYQPQESGFTVQVKRDGTPLESSQYESVTVDERVMEWNDAKHIHAWFVKNVQNGVDNRDEYVVQSAHLEKLLAVCEKVLHASHLVPETDFSALLDVWPSPSSAAMRSHQKVIKNVSTAHKLLPARSDGSAEPYGEAYLKAVDDTRSWILRMLADAKDGVRGTLYYSTSW